MAKKGKKKDVLVVGSKVREYIKSNGTMCSGDLVEALSEEVYTVLDRALRRTNDNGRKTIRSYDL